MWGNIVTEIALQTNFGIGFNNTKTDTLIHLTQWQYWWWFWFSFLWVFYYMIILRVVRFRTLKFRPRIATTFRPHGKWGDLIICLIPISWCANIITNSTLILRMIEWQAETGIITLRVRGKQWYWIYKFELKTITDIMTTPKNIGRNKWQITTPLSSETSNDFLHILQLRSQNKWVKSYWTNLSQKFSKKKNYSLLSLKDQLKYNFYENYNKLYYYNELNKITLKFNFSKKLNTSNLVDVNEKYSFFKNNNNSVLRVFNKKKFWNSFSDKINFNNLGLDYGFFNLNRKDQITKKNSLFLFFKNNKQFNFKNNFIFGYNDFLESNRWVKRGNNFSPLRLIKYPISNKTNFFSNSELKNSEIDLFKFRFNDNSSSIKHKPTPNSTYLTLKQKRYKRRKNILPKYKFEKFIDGGNTKKVKLKFNPFLFNNENIINNFGNPTSQYNLLKKNKNRYENTSLVLSKRILRTRRTLVLPAHVNITVITNSYDVIHSWFIPGLGLKMDCIPGRSTHHNFYIDNVGFYYGQCAEICGRYHHHMPIRICALPFEHFLLWWHNFGLPKLLFTKNTKRFSYHYGTRKYRW